MINIWKKYKTLNKKFAQIKKKYFSFYHVESYYETLHQEIGGVSKLDMLKKQAEEFAKENLFQSYNTQRYVPIL